MAVIIQYEFDTENEWETAGNPKLVDTATVIVSLGKKTVGYDSNDAPILGEKYYVEVLFADLADAPDNGLANKKATEPIPHMYLGFENVERS